VTERIGQINKQKYACVLVLIIYVFILTFWDICHVGEIKEGFLRIGDTSVPVYSPETKTKVPDVLFYENAQVILADVEIIIC